MAIACSSLALAGPAISQDIEPSRSLFETRAVKISVVVPAECDESLGDSCSPNGSGVILNTTEDTAFIATAAHVIDPLYTAGLPVLDDLTLDWPNRPPSCSIGLQPKAIWRPVAIQGAADDIAFIVADVECASPLPIVTNAWRDGTPSYGVTMHYVDIYSPFGTQRLSSPIYLSDSCILSRNCFNDGLVRPQGRIEGKRSGSAFFSAAGLVGVAIRTDGVIAAPRIDEVLHSCASGSCDAAGTDVPLAPWAERFSESLLPAKPYTEVGYADDVKLVTTFLDDLPPDQDNRVSQSGCAVDERIVRAQIGIAAGLITVEMQEVIERKNCTQWPNLSGIRLKTCVAQIDAIDPAIEIWSGPTMRLACASGDCFSCDTRYDAELAGHDDVRDYRSYKIEYTDFPVSDPSYFFGDSLSLIPERGEALDNFGRAFARIISGGSDEEFCQKNFIDC